MGNLFAFELRYQVRTGQGEDVGPAAMQKLTLAFERGKGHLDNAGTWIGKYVLESLEDFEARQFRGQGIGPNRGQWAKLGEAYEAWKTEVFGPQPIMVRTGALRESLTNPSSPEAIREKSATNIRFGSRLQYGHYHQLGTVRMVDRPLFDFDARFEKKLRAGVLKGVRDALRDAKVDEDLGRRIAQEEAGS